MSNKQVAAIFIIGIALLLAAFWAGLLIVKQDAPASANQSPSAAPNQNAASQANKLAANANLVTRPPGAGTDENAQYVVLIGTFGTLEQAKQLETDMRRDYIATHVQLPSGGDTLYRVVIGPYKKRDAEQVAADLSNKRKGIMIQPWTQN
jgi:cell division septation protein DedD